MTISWENIQSWVVVFQVKSDDLGDQEGAGNAAFMLDMAEDVSWKELFKARIILQVEITQLLMPLLLGAIVLIGMKYEL